MDPTFDHVQGGGNGANVQHCIAIMGKTSLYTCSRQGLNSPVCIHSATKQSRTRSFQSTNVGQ